MASDDVTLRGSDCRSPACPFPEGWYFVASRDEIGRRSPIEKTWLGQEIVAWCDGTWMEKPRPVLNRTDGQIMLFRRFCRQFYPDRPEAFATERPRREVAS